MPKIKFDHQTLTALTAEKRLDFYDTITAGLVLRVTEKGAKTFSYRYRSGSLTKRFTIGQFPNVTLAKARSEVIRLKSQILSGIDPQKERQIIKRAPDPETFMELCEEFKDKYLPQLRTKTRAEHTRIIDKELTPKFGNYPIKEITRNQIINLFDDISIKRKKPTQANRIRSRLHTIFNFAIERGLVDFNPVTSIKPKREGEQRGERFYTEVEITKLWQAFDELNEPAASILKMLMLSGQRKTETTRMRWKDIDNNTWTIPSFDSKSNRAHDVPLTKFSLELIEKLRPWTGRSEFIFASPVNDGNAISWLGRAQRNVRDKTGIEDFKLHDLRRTVATYMAKLKVDRVVIGKVLNHKGLSGDRSIIAIYDRFTYASEKREAMEKWHNELQKIIQGKTEAFLLKKNG